MKTVKYVLLPLIILIIGFAAGFTFLKMKNAGNVVILTPLPIIKTFPSQASSFSLENAPTESLRGQITAMTGEIDWTGRTATEAAKISSPITIQQGEELTTGKNSNLSLVFTGACMVKLSQKTDIQIIQTLPANIVFNQVEGTAEFIKTGNNAISVRALNLLTEINGDVTVSINPAKPIITLSLKSGQATVAYNDLKDVSHEVEISARQTYTFNSGTRRGVLR
ncbi:MAG: hypothetical protein ABSE04_00590 [Candidatus Microgenomates bacterium]|jgi:hypothetical protein